ncbi:MAG: hypothetical protein HY804_14230 [Nitrospinae bacterium]|nr:hypothetical protein [Nitrospinota bacterium]
MWKAPRTWARELSIPSYTLNTAVSTGYKAFIKATNGANPVVDDYVYDITTP